MKQVIQLIFITIVGSDVGARGVLVEKTGVPGRNPPGRAGDPHTFSRPIGESNPDHLGERQVCYPLHHPTTKILLLSCTSDISVP